MQSEKEAKEIKMSAALEWSADAEAFREQDEKGGRWSVSTSPDIKVMKIICCYLNRRLEAARSTALVCNGSLMPGKH